MRTFEIGALNDVANRAEKMHLATSEELQKIHEAAWDLYKHLYNEDAAEAVGQLIAFTAEQCLLRMALEMADVDSLVAFLKENTPSDENVPIDEEFIECLELTHAAAQNIAGKGQDDDLIVALLCFGFPDAVEDVETWHPAIGELEREFYVTEAARNLSAALETAIETFCRVEAEGRAVTLGEMAAIVDGPAYHLMGYFPELLGGIKARLK